MVCIPLKTDFTVDVDILKMKINKNTIMIVASAPSYPHGVIDPIEEIGQIACEKGIPFHVDSCLGGFFLPFVEQIGYLVPAFDFRCKGVTSISADVHKYGFGAKGASILLYKNMTYLKHQFFVHANWPGGVFASPALLGTRPGGPIAAAWAAMNAMVTPAHEAVADQYLMDLRKTVEFVKAHPDLASKGNAAMYGMIANVPFRGIIKKEVRKMMEKMYSPDGEMPMDNPDKASLPVRMGMGILKWISRQKK